MTTIEIKYLGNKVDTVNNGFFNALGKEALRKEYISKVQNKVKNLDDIEKVIEIIKTIEDENNIITPNTVFIITIKSEKYYLSNSFKIISKDEFERLNFVPHIKFDKSNCDISREEKRINQILKHKNFDEAMDFLNDYVKKIPKSFKQLSNKPDMIYLYGIDNDKIFYFK
ncbi:MAG: hypothetical protein AB7I39_10700 [Arcobacter sp.]